MVEYDESNDTVIAINSYLMNTHIHLTLEDFRNFLSLPPGGVPNEKGPVNPTNFVPSNLAINLDMHDQLLHLVISWIFKPISKHLPSFETQIIGG